MKEEIRIGSRIVGDNRPVYFIADIAANHDGDLARAKDLIHLAAEGGADAAKFQHFQAKTIVSDWGFKNMGAQTSHQAAWKKSVFDVYADASLNPDWTAELKATCDKAGIEFMTSPYSKELVDIVDPFLNAYKIGSGDITFFEILEHIAGKGKPVILAAGASEMSEVKEAVALIRKINPSLVLMQCNTNYTASLENFKYLNLKVLSSFAREFPDLILGLSDHTPGHSSTLGAVALGARMIEKHFTDDNNRVGPDHKFAMNPKSWREMVERCRELEASLGDGVKRIEDNEKDTIIVQRRSLRAARDLKAGTVLSSGDVTATRPCPADGIPPSRLKSLLGRTLKRDVGADHHFAFSDFE